MKAPVHNEERLFVINKAIQELSRGRNNATGNLTLATGATTTTISNDIVTEKDFIILSPTNAAAATEAWFIVSAANGSFVVGHSNAATVRTFRYVMLGGE